METGLSNPPHSPRRLGLVFGVVIVLTLWFMLRGWHDGLFGRHEFRQFQTAISAYWMKEAGYRLDFETPLFGPPWSIPLEFPVYQWIVAETSRLLGTGLESTARGVSVFFFFATMPAIYGLAGLLKLAPSRRLLVMGTVLSSPIYLFYGRGFLIETTALCFSVWFLYLVARAVRDQSAIFSAFAAACATLAGLAKVTTLLVFMPSAGLLAWTYWRHRWKERTKKPARLMLCTVYAVLPVLLSVGISYWWVRHGDHVKDINPFAGFLKSTEMNSWTFGTMPQRFTAIFWTECWSDISNFILGAAPLTLLLFCSGFVEPNYRRTAAWCALFFFGGPLLFANLYYQHDYYYCATAVFLLAGAGFLLAGIWDSARLPMQAKWTALLLVFGAQFGLFFLGFGEYQRRAPARPPGIALVARDVLPRDGVIVIYGWDWNAMLPYYAERRAIMIPRGREQETKVLDDILAQLPPLRVAGLIVHNENGVQLSPSFLRERLNRFNFSETPVATSPEGDLYLPEEKIPAALSKLGQRNYSGVAIGTTAPNASAEPQLKDDDPHDLAVPIFTPAPFRARSVFGIQPGTDNGKTVVLAHPVSELHFHPPAGAKQIDAAFGLSDGAFGPANPAPSDGITVQILEVQPDGQNRVLFQRDIDPLNNAADRGPQAISLTGIGTLAGTLIFKITPGPQNNLSSDWAYWARIEIR